MKRMQIRMEHPAEDWSAEGRLWWSVILTWVTDAEHYQKEWANHRSSWVQNWAFRLRCEIADPWAVRICSFVDCSIDSVRKRINQMLAEIPALEVPNEIIPQRDPAAPELAEPLPLYADLAEREEPQLSIEIHRRRENPYF